MADDILGLLQQFEPTAADRKAALYNSLLAAGLGMMGARRGDEMAALGRGGLLGMANYNQQINNTQQAAIERMKAATMAMQLREMNQKFTDQDEVRKALGAVAVPQQASPMQSAMASAPSLAPTVGNVASVTQQAANTPAPGVYERLTAMADQLEQQAKILKSPAVLQKAQETRLLAEKYAPQYEGTETAMDQTTGQPVLMQKYKNRAPTAVSGFAPKPEYKEVSDNKNKFFYDPLTGKTAGSFAMQVGPEAQLRADLEGRGQDITVRGQNMADARARELAALQREQNQINREQNQWQADDKAGLRVNKVTGEVRPLTLGGKPLGTEDQRKQAVGSAQALSVIDEAKKIIPQSTGSYAGNILDKGAQVFGMSTGGANAIAQLKVMEAKLMAVQPRMEGQQSNLDLQLYRQAAGQIGDPTVPREQKMRALEAIEALHRKYPTYGLATPAGAAQQPRVIDFNSLPK